VIVHEVQEVNEDVPHTGREDSPTGSRTGSGGQAGGLWAFGLRIQT
jgi:hypothetical protein